MYSDGFSEIGNIKNRASWFEQFFFAKIVEL